MASQCKVVKPMQDSNYLGRQSIIHSLSCLWRKKDYILFKWEIIRSCPLLKITLLAKPNQMPLLTPIERTTIHSDKDEQTNCTN